jgi:hypothetical protein
VPKQPADLFARNPLFFSIDANVRRGFVVSEEA